VNVKTEFQVYGWVAVDDDTYDGPGCPIGIGFTEREAIQDLQEQLEEES